MGMRRAAHENQGDRTMQATVVDGHAAVGAQPMCQMALPMDHKTGAPIIANRLVKYLDRQTIACDQCRLIATPQWERPRTTPTLGQQIQADMRRRYGPGIENPEWAAESYR